MMKDFSMLQFSNEVFFYTRILPFFESSDEKISDLFPRYYNSLLQYNTSSDEAVIVLENLIASGYSPTEKKSFLDYHHLRLMVRKLGVFHAYSYHMRQEAADKFHAMILCQLETDSNVLLQFSCFRECVMRGFRRLTTDPCYRSKIQNLSHLIENCDEVYRSILTGDERNCTHILCHGDFLRNNVLFAYDEGKPVDAKIVDLASWRFASPVIDLALLLYLNADQKMRDKNWDNLIDEYYAAVCGTFPSVRVPSKNLILAEFKTNAMMAYFIASFFLPSLIASDNDDVPGYADILPSEYKDVLYTYIPSDLLHQVHEKQGGLRATVALADILKDIIDRGFV